MAMSPTYHRSIEDSHPNISEMPLFSHWFISCDIYERKVSWVLSENIAEWTVLTPSIGNPSSVATSLSLLTFPQYYAAGVLESVPQALMITKLQSDIRRLLGLVSC